MRRFAAVAVIESLAMAATVFVPNHHGHKSVSDYLASGAIFFGLAGVGLLLARRLPRLGC